MTIIKYENICRRFTFVVRARAVCERRRSLIKRLGVCLFVSHSRALVCDNHLTERALWRRLVGAAQSQHTHKHEHRRRENLPLLSRRCVSGLFASASRGLSRRSACERRATPEGALCRKSPGETGRRIGRILNPLHWVTQQGEPTSWRGRIAPVSCARAPAARRRAENN